jgi:hypothetical protein
MPNHDKISCPYCSSTRVEKKGKPFHVDGTTYAQMYNCMNREGCAGYRNGGGGYSFSAVTDPNNEEAPVAYTDASFYRPTPRPFKRLSLVPMPVLA